MPWKETCAVEERLLLLADWLKGALTGTECVLGSAAPQRHDRG
jgi:hypothetical protein